MVSDERQILNLLHTYCELQDAGDLEAVAELFRHATYGVPGSISITDYDEHLATTRAQVRIYEDGTTRTHHVTSNTILDIDGLEAKSRSYFTVFQATSEMPLQPIIAGQYHDRFEKVDGSWRFSERAIHSRLLGDLSGHARINPF